MTFIDTIKKIAANRGESKQKLKEIQEDRRLHHIADEREKSANQRELERHFRDQREAEFKEELDKIRSQQSKDLWSSNSILKSDFNILKNDRPILKEKNIFTNGHSMGFLDGGNQMFFKF